MAIAGLPEGFELDEPVDNELDTNQAVLDVFDPQEEPVDTGLPDGFELDSAEPDLANEPISPELQAADPSLAAPQKGKFASFMESFRGSTQEPAVEKPASEAWHEMLPNDPNKTYGTILPMSTDKTTGETEWAVPDMIRSIPRGIGDAYKTAEESAKRGEFAADTVTPEGVLSPMIVSPGSVASRSRIGVDPRMAETAAPKAAPKTTPVLDSELTMQKQQEALAKVALGARNPTTLTGEQIGKQLEGAPKTSWPSDIDAEIKQLAADTATPGNKERLAELQRQKAELNKSPTPTNEINSDQFATNIYYPVQDAISAGASPAAIEKELRAGLQAAQRSPEEIDDLVKAAIPDDYKNLEPFGKEVAQVEGVAPNTAQGIIDISTPDDGSILVPLTPSDIKLKGKFRSKLADSTNMMSLIGKKYAQKNGIDVGSASLRELDDWTAARNLSQRGSTWWRSIVGNPNGEDKGILWTTQGSELKPVKDIDNFHASIVKARQAGMSSDELSEVMNVYNAYDDYANIDRILNDAGMRKQTAQGLLRNGNLSKADIAAYKQEIKDADDIIKEYTGKETFLTRQEVQQGVQKYANNPAAQDFLQNKNKINRKLIEGLESSGRITSAEANRLLQAHPNYAPSWRDVEDFKYTNIEISNSGGSPQPFKYRAISDKEVRNPIETTTNNIVNNIRKIEQTQYRKAALDFLMPRLDDDAWKVIFRENKKDVQKAIADIQAGKKQKWGADEITATDPTKVQKVGNIVFDVDGGQIQLTIKDPQLFQEFSNSRMWSSTNPWYDQLEKVAHFSRNMISLDPQFSLRNIQRESMDSIVGAKTSFWQKLKSPATNVKNIFSKELNPDLYEHVTNNIGYASQRGQRLMDIEDVGKLSVKVAESTPSQTGRKGFFSLMKDTSSGNQGGSAVQSLENFANRFDMAPRISVYEWTLRDGINSGLPYEKAHEAAIFAAKNLGVNFTQRGSNTGFDKVIRVIPFSRSFINSTDRMVMLGRYEPERLARNTFVGLYVPYKTAQAYNSQFVDVDGVPFQDKLDPTLKKDMLPIYGPWSKSVNDYFPLRLGWVYGRSLPALDKSLSYMMQEIGSKMDAGVAQDLPNILSKNQETKQLNPKEVMAAWTDYLTGVAQPGSMLPPGARQAVELATNQDYLGRQIVPDYLKDAPPSGQYTENTPRVLTDFSYYLSKRGIEVSPMVSQYLLNSLFASSANYATQAADMMYNASTNRERPEMEGKDIPFLPIISGKTTNVPKEGVEGQFANVGKYLESVNAKYRAIQERTKYDPNAFNDLQNFEIENAQALNYFQEYKALKGELSPIRDTAKNIINADKDTAKGYQTPEVEKLGDPKKRESVDKLRKTSIEAQKAFLKKIQTDPNADDIWYERMTRTPLTKGVEKLLPDGKPDKKVDKEDKTSYNFWDNFSLISSAQAADNPPLYPDAGIPKGISKGMDEDTTRGIPRMLDMPPAIIQEAPKQQEKGFFRVHFPNINKEVDKVKTAGKDSYYKNLAMAESSNNPNAKATTSSATGKYQFLKGTWASVVKKYGKEHGLTEKGITKESQQDKAIRLFTEDNKKQLAKKLDIPLARIDNTATYAAHFLGVNGAATLLTTPYNTPAAKVLPDAAKANKSIFYDDKGKPKTVKEVINIIEDKING